MVSKLTTMAGTRMAEIVPEFAHTAKIMWMWAMQARAGGSGGTGRRLAPSPALPSVRIGPATARRADPGERGAEGRTAAGSRRSA
ncbi:hypothetical protein SCE1572_21410 [Sorangium cellulosum So0157-2]|uniref:Uncharacterized protein n=1 Tax=Sorangium cellulosum So0157-2 TaxID=1254432 RepID=S4Y1Q2_SORCE|nr:hypothetical protein SCE1572_21410 [Sorangium cellulosum So0157-2]